MIVMDLRCPGCGHPLKSDEVRCEYCGRPIEISSFSETESLSIEDLKKHILLYNTIIGQDERNATANFSKGICFLKLKLYDNALDCFNKAIEADFSFEKAYLYAAVATMKGNTPFVLSRTQINQAEAFLNDAISFNGKGIYFYLAAFIRYDYHNRKSFFIKPDYKDYLLKAIDSGVSKKDIESLFTILNLDIKKAL